MTWGYKRFFNYLSAVKPLLGLIWQAGPWHMVVVVLCALFVGLAPTFLIYVVSRLIDLLTSVAGGTVADDASGILSSPARRQIALLVFLLITGNIVTQVLEQASEMVRYLFNARVVNRIQLLIARKAVSVDLGQFEDAEFQNQLRVVFDESPHRPMSFLDNLVTVLSGLVTLVSMSVVILLWQGWMLPIVLATSLISLWVSVRFGSARFEMINKRAEIERTKWYIFSQITSESSAKEVRSFELQEYLLDRLQTVLQKLYRQDQSFWTKHLTYASSSELIAMVVQGGLVMFTALQAVQGLISVGSFNFYYQLIIQIRVQASTMMSALGEMHESQLFADNLNKYLATEPVVEAQPHRAEEQPAAVGRHQVPKVKFENVAFVYPGAERYVLHDVNFEITPGEVVALVGENGAGKSTLIKLMSGLYNPTAGRILFDDVDISTMSRKDIRSKLSVAFQDYTIFQFSLRDNVGIGDVASIADEERIHAAANRTGLDRLVNKLPEGYDTTLGRFWEGGHELSGGQKQLVALTRSFFRKSAILILDEPSASLDVEAENVLFRELVSAAYVANGNTVLFVSHRFTTIRRADRIIVFKGGKVVEEGRHTELMSSRSYYFDMVNQQLEFHEPVTR